MCGEEVGKASRRPVGALQPAPDTDSAKHEADGLSEEKWRSTTVIFLARTLMRRVVSAWQRALTVRRVGGRGQAPGRGARCY